MKKLIFFLIASAILIFSIIIVNIAPIINGKINNSDTWFTQSCGQLSDNYKYGKEQTNDEDILKPLRKNKDRCYRKQAMYGLEYTTSNLNIIFGFVCALLGFLLFLNLVNIGKYIGLIGLGTGCIGFVLTFVYVIESGLVFNDIIDSSIFRIDSDGAYLEWNESKKRYTCIFYDKNDDDSILLKYSDLGNKYLSYNKDVYYAENEKNYKYLSSNGCISNTAISNLACKQLEELDSNLLTFLNAKRSYYDSSTSISNKQGECDRLFNIQRTDSNENEQIYNSWLTTIIFSCFIFLLYIALAIFGFLVFRESGGSSGQVAIK